MTLTDEIARLRRHVERLSLEQQALIRRFDLLSAQAPARAR